MNCDGRAKAHADNCDPINARTVAHPDERITGAAHPCVPPVRIEVGSRCVTLAVIVKAQSVKACVRQALGKKPYPEARREIFEAQWRADYHPGV